MSIISHRPLAAILLAVLGLVAAPAAAQDGVRLARECVQRMQEITETNIEQDQALTRRTIAALRDAVGEGAPDRVLRGIAGAGVQRIEANTDRARRAIHATAYACVQRLMDLGASRELIEAVRRVAVGSNEKLDEAAARSKRAIHEALERALG